MAAAEIIRDIQIAHLHAWRAWSGSLGDLDKAPLPMQWGSFFVMSTGSANGGPGASD